MTQSHDQRVPGLPADRDEDGSVLRLKDILRPMEEGGGAGFAVLGFACDAGVRRNFGRPGAANGPPRIREKLLRLPVHRTVTVADAGDIPCIGDELERAQEQLAHRVAQALRLGHLPIVFGGGHETAYGSFLGLIEHLGPAAPARRIAIVNLDAHFDLRTAPKRNSGTPFLDIANACSQSRIGFHYFCAGISRQSNTSALFEKAERLGVTYWRDEDLRTARLVAIARELETVLREFDDLYLSIDLDVFQAAVAPGVSSPAPGGITVEAGDALLDVVRGCGKLRLADIVECNPEFDRDGQTAALAARLAWRIMFGG